MKPTSGSQAHWTKQWDRIQGAKVDALLREECRRADEALRRQHERRVQVYYDPEFLDKVLTVL